MKLKCIASGSSGNCYLLENESQCLILDAGVSFKEVKKALDFNVSKISGVVISHSHGDHAKYSHEYERIGIPVFKPYECVDCASTKKFDNFTVRTFDVVHDVPCFGFYIIHPEIGSMIYVTDTEYIKWKFRDVNHILLGVNYDERYINREDAKFQHVIRGHMSINTACDFLKVNNSRNLQNVVFCHLSKWAADPLEFVQRANEIVSCKVSVAERGMEIEFEKQKGEFEHV